MTEVTLTEADLPAIDRLLKKMRAEESTPMLTLDEAVAWLDKMLELHLKPCGEPDCGECLRDTRAAVRDVALATIQYLADWRAENELAVPIHGFSETEAEINRLFPHG